MIKSANLFCQDLFSNHFLLTLYLHFQKAYIVCYLKEEIEEYRLF